MEIAVFFCLSFYFPGIPDLEMVACNPEAEAKCLCLILEQHASCMITISASKAEESPLQWAVKGGMGDV